MFNYNTKQASEPTTAELLLIRMEELEQKVDKLCELMQSASVSKLSTPAPNKKSSLEQVKENIKGLKIGETRLVRITDTKSYSQYSNALAKMYGTRRTSLKRKNADTYYLVRYN